MEIYGISSTMFSVLTLMMSLQLVYGQDTAACTVNPCKNGGVCFPQPNSEFFCLCVIGFTGKTCIGDIVTTVQPTEIDTTSQSTSETEATSMTSQQTTARETTSMASTTTQKTTLRATTVVQTTSMQTTNTVSKSTRTKTDGSISTMTDSSSSEVQTEVAMTSRTDSSSSEVGADTTSASDSNEVTVSSRMRGDMTTPSKETNEGPPDNETVTDKDPTFLWILFLILFAMLIIAAIITLVAVKRASKQHGKYDPNAALSAHERSSGSSNGVAAEGTINPGHNDDVV